MQKQKLSLTHSLSKILFVSLFFGASSAESQKRAESPKAAKRAKQRYITVGFTPNFKNGAELGTQAFIPNDSDDSPGLLGNVYGIVRSEIFFEPTHPQHQSRSYLLSGALRLMADREGDHEFSIRTLSASMIHNKFRLEGGFQEVAWGETFGVYILDLVNPRDFRDPLSDNLSFTRQAVFALNSKIFLGRTTLQTVITPIPRNNHLPKRESYYDPFPDKDSGVVVRPYEDFKVTKYGRDAEFGGRVSHLLESGFELSALYWDYWNRNVLYDFAENGDLVPVRKRVRTAGFSFNKPFERIVLRGDAAYHWGYPVQYDDFAPSKGERFIQSILGADANLEGRWTLGAQYHLDWYEKEKLHWLSFKVGKSFWKNQLKGEVYYFHGLDNRDQWFQPKLTWEANDRVSASVGFDWVKGDKKESHSYLYALDSKDRVFLSAMYRF